SSSGSAGCAANRTARCRSSRRPIRRPAVRNLKILLILGACALVPSATALAQCSGACGPGVCPSLPYTGPTACFPPPAATCTVGPVTFVNQTTLSWPAGDLACAPLVYDVAIGDLACLKGT